MFVDSQAGKVPKRVQRHVTICYSGKTTPIRALIDIDGYFLMPIIRKFYGVQHLYDPGSSIRTEWHLVEEKFLAVDRRTLIRVKVEYLAHQVQSRYETDLWKEAVSRQHAFPARFTSDSAARLSNCWLKNEDWINCK